VIGSLQTNGENKLTGEKTRLIFIQRKEYSEMSKSPNSQRKKVYVPNKKWRMV
jgi:hypothetical protein